MSNAAKMTPAPTINISDFDYRLPLEKIAKYPLTERDMSKLLVVKNDVLKQDVFLNISDHLPSRALLVFNETRVIPARIKFKKDTGAEIEVFLIDPVGNSYESALSNQSPSEWNCLVGNSKKWKAGNLSLVKGSADHKIILKAERLSTFDKYSRIRFDWTPSLLSFSEVLDTIGAVPLPPYLNRESDENDRLRYQTIYARYSGSVAAPTAGLHFTQRIFNSFHARNISTAKLTLHVGAGTFRPVLSDSVHQHQMHEEKVVVSRDLINRLLESQDQFIVPVGTTSIRTLESLYWFGVKLIEEDNDNTLFHVSQWEPYRERNGALPERNIVLERVHEYMIRNRMDHLEGATQLMIIPGYKFQFADAIITNFHQPKSTLLLLIAAFLGPLWEKAYAYALANDFRFLSYGDSCLFFKNNDQ